MTQRLFIDIFIYIVVSHIYYVSFCIVFLLEICILIDFATHIGLSAIVASPPLSLPHSFSVSLSLIFCLYFLNFLLTPTGQKQIRGL